MASSKRDNSNGKSSGQTGPVSYENEFAATSEMASKADQTQVKQDGITIQVQQGDLTKEDTDAIVNSTNPTLDLTKGAVSKAILNAGGQEIQQECRKQANPKDGIVITGAGRLPSTYIVHIVAPQGKDAWKTVIRKSLKKADCRKIKSIAFPALGTGALGHSAAEMANITYDAIADFVKHDKPKHLKCIQITIFEQQMVDDYKTALSLKGGTTTKQGFFSKAGNFIMSLLGSNDPVVQDNEQPLSIASGYSNYTPSFAKETNVSRFQPGLQQSPTKQLTRVNLIIYTFDENVIPRVKKALELHCKDQTYDGYIDEEPYKTTIGKLSKHQEDELTMSVSNHPVKIRIQTRLKRIHVSGNMRHVLLVIKDIIYPYLRRVQDDERTLEDAKMRAKFFQWEWSEDGVEYDTYSERENIIIEKAYLGNLPDAVFSNEHVTRKIIFATNIEEISGFKVRRTEKKKTVFPSTWARMATDDVSILIKLDPACEEYLSVQKSFSARYKTIIKIERIQTPGIYERYISHKEQLNRLNKKGIVNERILWHGTDANSTKSISRLGFNRSYHGKNAVLFGKGTYFAVNPSYSVDRGYSEADANNICHIYRCLVLTGEYAQGKKEIIVPPQKDPQDSTILYDSVVDNVDNPSIFVIFQDAQAYPEYIITFEKVNKT